ncbi:hypothetical protein DPMN_035179 [Dreissena polymorpha]|uniref:Uncharacterized protein n=1 Tax=Dreissena polymorpha TaxID=45954 RepID=A0A9D4RKP4_DREPO|nr:hypothetical protein DPMN_035179 [Dreissena polymorpha]
MRRGSSSCQERSLPVDMSRAERSGCKGFTSIHAASTKAVNQTSKSRLPKINNDPRKALPIKQSSVPMLEQDKTREEGHDGPESLT